MSSLPQQRHYPPRPTRVRPSEFTPAVLRFPNGGCTPGELQMFSLSGGLLGVPKPLNQGAHVKLMFLTETGPVLGEAELLRPISWTAQPFRFVSLREGDQHRLEAAIQPWRSGGGMGCPACECPGAWPKSAPAAWGCMPEFTCSRMSLWRSNSWRPRKPESRESFAAAPVVFSDWNLLLLSQFKMIPGWLGN